MILKFLSDRSKERKTNARNAKSTGLNQAQPDLVASSTAAAAEAEKVIIH